MKSAGKLIAFVAAYTAVAYLVLAILGAMTDSDIAAGPMLLAALLVAMVTALFDEKGTGPSRARAAVLVLLVPVTGAWLYFGYQTLNADFPEPGYIWQPLLCIALFVTPTLIGKRLRRKRRGWRAPAATAPPPAHSATRGTPPAGPARGRSAPAA